MQFDFKEKAKKRQDRNSPIKPFFVYNLKIHPKFHGVNSKFLWGLFSPHGVPPFLTAPTKVWLPRFCWNFNGYGLRSASFSLKYRPIRRGWCSLWLLHRYRPSPFGIFRHLRKFDITKLIFARIWSIIFIKKCSKMPLCLKSRIGGCQYDQCYD